MVYRRINVVELVYRLENVDSAQCIDIIRMNRMEKERMKNAA